MQLINIAQIAVSIILVALIIPQGQGGGLGAAFGSSTAYHTRRGLEKSTFYLTIVFAVLFIGISIATLL